MSIRQKAWRNIVVAATNAALEQGLFSYPRQASEPADAGAIFDFEMDGATCVGHVRDVGFEELAVHALVNVPWPSRHFVASGNIADNWLRTRIGAEAAATGYLERKLGFYLQLVSRDGPIFSMSCRKGELAKFAAIKVEPAGYADAGPYHL